MRPNEQKVVAQSARIIQKLVEEGACRSEMVSLSVDFAFEPLARMLTMQTCCLGFELTVWRRPSKYNCLLQDAWTGQQWLGLVAEACGLTDVGRSHLTSST